MELFDQTGWNQQREIKSDKVTTDNPPTPKLKLIHVLSVLLLHV